MELGDCHWQEPRIGTAHRWVIISLPDRDGAVQVNFTSPGGYITETTCVVTPRECDFLDHDSLVAYQFAELITLDDYQSRKAQGLLTRVGRVAPAVVRRMQDGALESRNVAGRHRAKIRARLVDPTLSWSSQP